MACKKDHSELSDIMSNLPYDQGGVGRHKCAACAYRKGFDAGVHLIEKLDINEILSSLEDSQAGSQRHKSPHAAYALGYYDGVCARTNSK